MKFTLYTANCTENAKNAVYPNKAEIDNEEDFKAAICRDHVSAEYKNSHRSVLDYICGDADVMDCDNDKTENPKEWVHPEMYQKLFPDVSFAIVPSRHDGKVKGNKSARPRHHVYFPHKKTTTADECAELKKRIYAAAPFLMMVQWMPQDLYSAVRQKTLSGMRAAEPLMSSWTSWILLSLTAAWKISQRVPAIKR